MSYLYTSPRGAMLGALNLSQLQNVTNRAVNQAVAMASGSSGNKAAAAPATSSPPADEWAQLPGEDKTRTVNRWIQRARDRGESYETAITSMIAPYQRIFGAGAPQARSRLENAFRDAGWLPASGQTEYVPAPEWTVPMTQLPTTGMPAAAPALGLLAAVLIGVKLLKKR